MSFVKSTGSVLGKYSYSIYISHYPVLFFWAHFTHSLIVYTLMSLPTITLLSYTLQNWLQPAMNSLFKKSKPAPQIEVPLWIAAGKLTEVS